MSDAHFLLIWYLVFALLLLYPLLGFIHVNFIFLFPWMWICNIPFSCVNKETNARAMPWIHMHKDKKGVTVIKKWVQNHYNFYVIKIRVNSQMGGNYRFFKRNALWYVLCNFDRVSQEFFISGGDGLPRGVVENQIARVRHVVKLLGYEVSLVNYIGKKCKKIKIKYWIDK